VQGAEIYAGVAAAVQVTNERDPALERAAAHVEQGLLGLESVRTKQAQLVLLELIPIAERSDHDLQPVVFSEARNECAQRIEFSPYEQEHALRLVGSSFGSHVHGRFVAISTGLLYRKK
jgi:hypothetical protein